MWFQRGILVLVLMGLCVSVFADVQLKSIRSWQSPEHTRFVLDVSDNADYLLSPDTTPGEIVLDLPHCQLLPGFVTSVRGRGVVRTVRVLAQTDGVRVILDLSADAHSVVFELKPEAKAGYRVVVDLVERVKNNVSALPVPVAVAPVAASTKDKPVLVQESTNVQLMAPVTVPAVAVVPDAAEPVKLAADDKSTNAPVVARSDKPSPEVPEKASRGVSEKASREVVVAIDAGHGGQDTGAIGPGRVYEKNITLAIAHAVQQLMLKSPGLKPVLTRSGDYFIPLVERREIARQHYHADIFISIHADASPSGHAEGASVFALSLKGANTATSRFARALADRENSADEVGGIHVREHDGVLANVLADMVVEGSLEHSLRLGQAIIERLHRFSPLHSRQVEQAGFAVLKEPGMVSVLVENGFITNSVEEKHLVNPEYQQKLAKAIVGGVQAYCRQFPLPGTYFADQAQKQVQIAVVGKKP